MATNKTVIIIAGPTATGKTALAIQLAQHFKTEIISADSRQCYKEMRIGVARPSVEELAQVHHHFVASHSIYEKVNAALFEKYALEKAEHLFSEGKTIVMVGGTGLYIKAFCEGLDEVPEVPENIRRDLNKQYYQLGLEWLQNEMATIAPGFHKHGEANNPHRLLRALEVFRTTGKSIEDFKTGSKKTRGFNVIKIGLDLPKEKLHQNINYRVDGMIRAGLEAEVRSLTEAINSPALQTVGYKEIFDFFIGTTDLPEAIERIKIHTRQYAKRQLTWFRKDTDMAWMDPDISVIIEFVNARIEALAI